jgi:hypothetical protein
LPETFGGGVVMRVIRKKERENEWRKDIIRVVLCENE